jgi:hypothetical protein
LYAGAPIDIALLINFLASSIGEGVDDDDDIPRHVAVDVEL